MRNRAQRIEKARRLIGRGVTGRAEVWADLGCGDGIFTSALADLVGAGSMIFAVDRDPQALQALSRNFTRDYPGLELQAVQADFTGKLDLPPLDGVLMANSLHFTRDQPRVMESLTATLKPQGVLILVEYNTARGNAAVPHPIDEFRFLDLVKAAGLQHGRILSRIPASFLGGMYAGIAHMPGPRAFDVDR